MITKYRATIEILILAILGFGFLGVSLGNRYLLSVATLVLICSIQGISMNIIWGLAGQFSMGQVGLMAVAAYGSSFTIMNWQWPFWLGALFGMGLTIGISLILGVITLQFREMHFAIATLAFTMLFIAVLNNWDLMGASGGMITSYTIPGIPIFPLSLIDGRTFEGLFMIALLATLLLLAGQAVFMGTRFGRGFIAIRENETLAQSIGIHVNQYKILAFIISSIPAAISGILYAPYITFIYPRAFGFELLVNTILSVAVGGVGYLAAPVLGSVIFGVLTELLRMVGTLKLAIYGVALILITLFTPGGLLGWLNSWIYRHRLMAKADISSQKVK